VHAQWKEVFRLLVLSRESGKEDRKHSALPLEEDGALRAHNLMKRIIVSDVKRSKLHMSQRSTAPHIVSTSQPPADRTILVIRSQHSHSSCCWTWCACLSSLVKTPKTPSWVKTAGKELSRPRHSKILDSLMQSWDSRSSSVHRRSPTEAHLCTVLQSWDRRSSSIRGRSPT